MEDGSIGNSPLCDSIIVSGFHCKREFVVQRWCDKLGYWENVASGDDFKKVLTEYKYRSKLGEKVVFIKRKYLGTVRDGEKILRGCK